MTRRLSRAALVGGALVAGLLAARKFVPGLADQITAKVFRADIEREAVWGRTPPPLEKVGVSQFIEFNLTIAFAAAAVALAVTIAAVLVRTRLGRRVEIQFCLAASALAICAAVSIVPFYGVLAFALVMLTVVFLVAYTDRDTPRTRAVSEPSAAAVIIGAEAVALAWGFWITRPPAQSMPALLLAFAIVAAVAWYLGRAEAARAVEQLRAHAITGAPLLCLPLTGLVREPTFMAPLLAVLACASLRLVLDHQPAQRIPQLLAAVIAPLSIAAIFLVPLHFRDLPTVSHEQHEAQHYGWIQSALFGRLLFADAGFMYGPLREYLLLAVSAALGGITIEHIRVTHILFNLVGTGVLLWVGWVVGKRRFSLLALWWYLLLVRSPLYSYLDYWNRLSFGWADVARCGLGALALLGALTAATDARDSKTRRRTLFGWGIGAGLALLYSHDVGVCAIAAVSVTLLADALLRATGEGLAERLVTSGLRLARFLAGSGLVVGSFVAFYVARGRGPALLRTLQYARTVGTGAFGASPYPLSVADFMSSTSLFAEVPGYGMRVDYIAPPLILVMGGAVFVMILAWRRWSARATLLLGFYVFAVILYRYALTRADLGHLLGGTPPAYLFLIAVLGDAFDFRPRYRNWPVPVAAFCAAVLAVAGIHGLDSDGGLMVKLKRHASGDEVISRGAAYVWPDLPHAGDVYVPFNTLELVRYIRLHTTSAQPIWVVTDLMNGGELYFLAERRDSTRYDLWAEVMLKNVEAVHVLEDLKQVPPAMIIGHRWRHYTREISNWVSANYVELPAVAGVEIRVPAGARKP